MRSQCLGPKIRRSDKKKTTDEAKTTIEGEVCTKGRSEREEEDEEGGPMTSENGLEDCKGSQRSRPRLRPTEMKTKAY